MNSERSPRVGLLALMLELYDESHPELKADREQFASRIVGVLQGFADVTYSGIRNTRRGVEEAVRKCVNDEVDAVVVVCLSYSPSLISLPALRSLNCPVILFNTQELAAVDETFNHDNMLKNHGVHGLHDLANVLNRNGETYHVVTGHFDDEEARRELADWCIAAYAAKRVRELKVGLVGHAFPGMGDFGVDETTLLSALGPAITRIDASTLLELRGQAPNDEVAAMMAADLEEFEPDEALTPAVHKASSRAEWALRRAIRDEGLGAVAIHYPVMASLDPDGALPFLGVSKLMAEGIGFGGEGDVTSASLVHLAGLLFGEASFTEMFTVDFAGEAVFHSHYAEANRAMARDDAPIRLVVRDGWVGCGGPAAALAFSNRPGPATVLNLTLGPGGRFRLIGYEGEVQDYRRAEFDSPHFKLKPDVPIKPFLTSYLYAGGSHHLAITEGRVLGRAAKLAELMGLEFIHIA